MENKARLRSLDILKGIAIISVVIGHAGFGNMITNYLSSFHLQLFFFVSGLLFTVDKYKEFTVYSKRRAKSLLVPYAAFAIVTIIVCLICSLLAGRNIYNLPESLKGIIWSNQSIFPITGGIWFLQCMFVVEIVYWLLTRFVSYKFLPVVALAFVALSFFQSTNALLLPFSIDSALSAIVFFCIGNALRPIFNSINSSPLNGQKNCLIAVVLIVSGAVLSYFNGRVNPRTCEYGNIILYYVCALVSIAGWTFLAIGLDRIKNKFIVFANNELEEAGKNSIVYLGLNQLVLAGLFTCCELLPLSGSSLIKAFRNILVCIATCIIIKYLARLIVSSRLKVFVGK